jgi:hypothetical protein
MSSMAVLLGIAAVLMSAITMSRPAPRSVTTTVTASAPSYGAEQIAAAKKEACEASATSAAPINDAQKAFAATTADRSSPNYKAALENWQTVLAVETQYLRYHLTLATPIDVADATNQYIGSLIALGDANTREASDQEAEKFIADTRSSGGRLTQLCGG